jgi:UDP-glucose 4-epimerase
MNVFVTGGAGYIGSVCVEELSADSVRETLLDLLDGHAAQTRIGFFFPSVSDDLLNACLRI